MSTDITCFKAYDVRGRVPAELDEDKAYAIACGYASFLKPETVIVGRDIRNTGPEIAEAVIDGLRLSGVHVIDIGVCGTEEVYFAVAHTGSSGGIMVTASHNPKDYNGLKMVREESRPISETTGLKEIKLRAEQKSFIKTSDRGSVKKANYREPYIQKLMSYVDTSVLNELTVVMNSGNGCAGPVVDLLEQQLPYKFIKMFHEPDGNFPNGVPNPMLEENRSVTTKEILKNNADAGIAWDGDCDRCFFFDEQGNFIEGYYIVGFLGAALVEGRPGEKVIYDPRLTWNTIEMVKKAGGVPLMHKSGHAFMKERMRKENALYGGEMSAHHYFREFSYCDSGMIPWLKLLELMCRKQSKLSELIEQRIACFPSSGEINTKVPDPDVVIAEVEAAFKDQTVHIDRIDGVSLEFETWRFNLRKSNTEPVIRLNVESRGDRSLMEDKTAKVLSLIKKHETT